MVKLKVMIASEYHQIKAGNLYYIVNEVNWTGLVQKLAAISCDPTCAMQVSK